MSTDERFDGPEQDPSGEPSLDRSGEQQVAPAGEETSAGVGAETVSLPIAEGAEEAHADALAEDEVRRRPWYRRWPFITTIVVLLLAAGYIGAAYLAGSRVPAGTKVWDVAIGSMGAKQARETLERELQPRLEQARVVTVADKQAELVPTDAGLGIDYDETVKSLTKFSLDPRHVYRALFGSSAVEPVQTVDEKQLDAAMSKLASAVNVEPVDANVVFEGGKPVITEPVSGVKLNEEEAASTFKAQYADQVEQIALPYDQSDPNIGEQELKAVQDEILTPLTSGPVVVVLGDDRAELSPEDLANTATIEMKPAAIHFDAEQLKKLATEKLPALGSTGKDARIVLEGGKPVVIPSQSGKALDGDDFVKQVSQAATAEKKEVTPAFTEADADFTTADANKLGVKEVVGEFDTPLTADRVRTTNLIVGTKAITNTLVKPGETFSLLKALGPVTYERGYVDSGVVNNGFATEALGGGLSQLSTTTMNAAFFAGMDLVEFRQHTRYFSRYPEGREATLWGPTLDMKWKNNTDYGILVDAYVANNRVYVRLWSTKVWTVESWTSERRNITSPQLVYNNRADCKPEHGTTPGFTVDFGRKRYKNGSLVDSQSWTWTYDAWPIVRCGSPGA